MKNGFGSHSGHSKINFLKRTESAEGSAPLFMLKINSILSLFILSLAFQSVAGATGKPWDVKKIKGQVIEFNNGKTLDTKLFHLKILGRLESGQSAPFLILTGTGCTDCDANTSLYIESAAKGSMRGEATQNRYSYPGTLKDYENGELLSKSRAFYGNCLTNEKSAVAWFQEDKLESGSWKKSVFIVSVQNGKLTSTAALKKLPSIDVTLQKVKEQTCSEIPGLEMTSEP